MTETFWKYVLYIMGLIGIAFVLIIVVINNWPPTTTFLIVGLVAILLYHLSADAKYWKKVYDLRHENLSSRVVALEKRLKELSARGEKDDPPR